MHGKQIRHVLSYHDHQFNLRVKIYCHGLAYCFRQSRYRRKYDSVYRRKVTVTDERLPLPTKGYRYIVILLRFELPDKALPRGTLDISYLYFQTCTI